jgi:dolichol-phosphate mannosyltransferase
MSAVDASRRPVVSVVVPVRNEQDNIAPLVNEVAAALAKFAPFEVIYVDDGSTDRTGEVLNELAASRPWLRRLRHKSSSGQSAAVRSGVRAARAPLVCTLDGDGQNDPKFLPRLIMAIQAGGPTVGLVQGQRVGRKDTRFKKLQSRIANRVRAFILRDSTRDTGCGLKCFWREAYLNLPYFDALHRFMPALMVREGYRIAHVDVVDRPRMSGVSNYGFWNRLWVGVLDLCGVWWLIRRKRSNPTASED